MVVCASQLHVRFDLELVRTHELWWCVIGHFYDIGAQLDTNRDVIDSTDCLDFVALAHIPISQSNVAAWRASFGKATSRLVREHNDFKTHCLLEQLPSVDFSQDFILAFDARSLFCGLCVNSGLLLFVFAERG